MRPTTTRLFHLYFLALQLSFVHLPDSFVCVAAEFEGDEAEAAGLLGVGVFDDTDVGKATIAFESGAEDGFIGAATQVADVQVIPRVRVRMFRGRVRNPAFRRPLSTVIPAMAVFVAVV